MASAVYFSPNSASEIQARLLSFINPEAHPEVSYQLLQSLYGMGNGGWFGVGLGQSRAKWSYLPNADSDFIFAIIGEELGLIGAGILLLLFALLAYTGLRIARRNVDPFVKIVASAATVWLVGQAAINIGYVVGLLPVTGIPLPMISAGGTSLLITMVVFGLLANFARREPQAAAALAAGGGGRLARFLGIRHSDSSGVKSASRRRRRKTAASAGAVAAASGPRRGTRTTGPGPEQPRRARRPMDRPQENPPRTVGSRGADQRGADQRGREPRPGERRAPDQRGGQQRRADPRGAGPRGAGQRGSDPRAAGPTNGGPRGRTGRRGGE